jgi:Fur family transcriptional regulator, peroxide stress response regulator
MTPTKNTILEKIKNSKKPINFEQIRTHLTALGQSPNKTTIYRNLEKLEEQKLINKVTLSDQKMYWESSHNHSDHQHLHLVCNICQSVECRDFENKIDLNISGFVVNDYEITVSGTCQKCTQE